MQRVVVTGFGAITPLGNTATATWGAAIAGKSGVAPITLFDSTDFGVTLAAEVKDWDAAQALGIRAARREDRFELLADVATNEALDHSGLEITDANCYRVGLSVSSAFGGLASMEKEITALN